MALESSDTAIRRQTRNILAFFAVVLGMYILKLTSSVMMPIIIALFIFIFINPYLAKMDKLKIPRVLSSVIVTGSVCLILFFLVYLFFIIINQLMAPDTGIPHYVQRIALLDRSLSDWLAPYLDEDPMTFSVLSWMNVDWYALVMAWLTNLSSRFMSVMSDAMLVVLYLMFLVLERQSVMPKLMAAFPVGKIQKAGEMLNSISKQVSRYLSIKFIISAVTGILFYFTAVWVKLDFALIWGVLATILNFIPTIGSIVVTVLGIFMAIIQFAPDWSTVLMVSFFFVVIEMVMGNIVDPHFQGVQLNLSPLVILIFLALWGYIWGIPGMFLSVPMTSVLQVFCANSPTLRPLSIMISEGSSYRRDFDKKERHKRRNRKQ